MVKKAAETTPQSAMKAEVEAALTTVTRISDSLQKKRDDLKWHESQWELKIYYAGNLVTNPDLSLSSKEHAKLLLDKAIEEAYLAQSGLQEIDVFLPQLKNLKNRLEKSLRQLSVEPAAKDEFADRLEALTSREGNSVSILESLSSLESTDDEGIRSLRRTLHSVKALSELQNGMKVS